ncbi:ABC1 family-domain-containing protein [Syncephalis fuscata]|nr:ABC1 family-domain-containing protein [Syncephalis fuscata]
MAIGILAGSTLLFGSGYYRFRRDISHAWSGVVRSSRAAYVAMRIGIDYQRTCAHLDEANPACEAIWSDWHQRSAERLLELCRTNGGVYIKLGQHLAAMTYILPIEWTETMRPLHAHCPPTPTDQVKQLIEEEMAQPMDELFLDFNSEPLGVASLAQVHRATLLNGDVVAVKVQHPPLQDHAMIDIATTSMLVRTVERLFPEFEFGWLAEEMKENLPLELDFRVEQRNAQRLDNYFIHDRGALVVPAVNWATARVLCMEFIEGSYIDDREFLRQHCVDVNDVSSELSRIFSDMIFKYGWVHCDPHPGNILIRPRKKKNLFDRNYDLVLLDHGLYKSLPRQLQTDYAHLWRSILERNEKDMRTYALRIGGFNTHRLFACILTGRSWSAVESDLTQSRSEEERRHVRDTLPKFLADIAHILRHVPREVLLLIKTHDLLRSVDASLNTTRHPAYGMAIMMSACNRAILQDDQHNAQVVSTLRNDNAIKRTWGQLRCWWHFFVAETTCRLLRFWLRLTERAFRFLPALQRPAAPLIIMPIENEAVLELP